MKIHLTLALLATFALIQESFAQPASYDFSAVDQLLEDSVLVGGANGRGYALLLVVDGERVYDRAFGNNYTSDRVVPIASASKWLSGAAIMTLVDDGLLSLDDTLGRWFPEAPAEKQGITIRQLFSLTSGFPGESDYHGDRSLTLEGAVDSIVQNLELVVRPGRGFIYSGVSMQVAGRIAEIVTGESWDSLFAHRIAEPLGMVATNFDGLGRTDNPQVAGGAQSSAEEYLLFLQMIAAKGVAPDGTRILSEESVATMLADQRRGAPIIYTPYGQYRFIDTLLPESAYGIGLWRETASFDPLPTPDLTSPGAFGFTPWIDVDRNLIGVFSVLSTLQQAAPTIFEMKKRVQNEMDKNASGVEEEIETPDALNLR